MQKSRTRWRNWLVGPYEADAFPRQRRERRRAKESERRRRGTATALKGLPAEAGELVPLLTGHKVCEGVTVSVEVRDIEVRAQLLKLPALLEPVKSVDQKRAGHGLPGESEGGGECVRPQQETSVNCAVRSSGAGGA